MNTKKIKCMILVVVFFTLGITVSVASTNNDNVNKIREYENEEEYPLCKLVASSAKVVETSCKIVTNLSRIEDKKTDNKKAKNKKKIVKSKVSESNQILIDEVCKSYNVSFPLVLALVEHESEGKEDVISSTGDYGLMQINECNHSWLAKTLGISDFLNPKENLKAGCYMISKLMNKYKNEPNKLLMAYNMGEGMASDFWDEGVYTSEYANLILSREKEIEKELK